MVNPPPPITMICPPCTAIRCHWDLGGGGAHARRLIMRPEGRAGNPTALVDGQEVNHFVTSELYPPVARAGHTAVPCPVEPRDTDRRCSAPAGDRSSVFPHPMKPLRTLGVAAALALSAASAAHAQRVALEARTGDTPTCTEAGVRRVAV